jgi:seryl-tRNA synthetase
MEDYRSKDEVFDKWLDKDGDTTITIEDKMILTLKAHLYIELREDIEKSRILASQELKEFREEQNKKWEESNKKWEDSNKKWEEQNKKWDENQKELRNIYAAINNQTWKMIGSVGLIVILCKLIDTFGK